MGYVKVLITPSYQYRELKSGRLKNNFGKLANPITYLIIMDDVRCKMYVRCSPGRPEAAEISQASLDLLKKQDLFESKFLISAEIEKKSPELIRKLASLKSDINRSPEGLLSGLAHEADDFLNEILNQLSEMGEAPPSCRELNETGSDGFFSTSVHLEEKFALGKQSPFSIKYPQSTKIAELITWGRGRNPEVRRKILEGLNEHELLENSKFQAPFLSCADFKCQMCGQVEQFCLTDRESMHGEVGGGKNNLSTFETLKSKAISRNWVIQTIVNVFSGSPFLFCICPACVSKTLKKYLIQQSARSDYLKSKNP